MTAVDLYCERVAPGLLGEPLNAVTNAAILVAAWLSWRFARRSGELSLGLSALIALLAAFGAGSALFHTFADSLTRWLDVLPIAAFIATYLWLYLRRVLDTSAAIAWLAVAVFAVAAVAARRFPGVLNGSIVYAPALVLVIGLGIVHRAGKCREPNALLAAAVVFVAAVFFRTIDSWACAAFPIGTHFLWHLLAAVALFLAMRALIANLSAAESRVSPVPRTPPPSS